MSEVAREEERAQRCSGCSPCPGRCSRVDALCPPCRAQRRSTPLQLAGSRAAPATWRCLRCGESFPAPAPAPAPALPAGIGRGPARPAGEALPKPGRGAETGCTQTPSPAELPAPAGRSRGGPRMGEIDGPGQQPCPGRGGSPAAGRPLVESFPGVTSHSTRPLGNLIQVFLSMGCGGATLLPGPRPG